MRRDFTKAVKLAAFQRADGRCEKCTAQLYPGKYRYDHVVPDTFGGAPTLENCQVICIACDSEKTYGKDIPAIAKNNRMRERNLGIKRNKTRRTIAGRRFDGTPIPSRIR
jgi:5-methylcytosine-specific restriction endonuclease McrA